MFPDRVMHCEVRWVDTFLKVIFFLKLCANLLLINEP